MINEAPEPSLEAQTLVADSGNDELAAAPALSRRRAIGEVLLCSGYPTQLTIAAILNAVGIRPAADGTLSPGFVFALSAIDTGLLLGLIFLFLRNSGDRPRVVFTGFRPRVTEFAVGVLTLPLLLVLVVLAQIVIRTVAPALRNVPVNPFMPLLGSPMLFAGFVVLVLVAGGVREELQRAFLLYRFDQRLGGAWLGVLITSAGFGLGHTLQGLDAAIVTALLGAFWGVLYLSRRSVVSTVTSHALFNLSQIALGYASSSPQSTVHGPQSITQIVQGFTAY